MPITKPDASEGIARIADLASKTGTSGGYRPAPPPRTAPQRWVAVDIVGLHPHTDSGGRRVGTRVTFRIQADDDDALWRFFDVRKVLFEQQINSAVRLLSRGAL